MIDYIIIGVVLLIVSLSAFYIIRQKKKGVKCIGCPDSGSCSGHCSGNCSGCQGQCGKHQVNQ